MSLNKIISSDDRLVYQAITRLGAQRVQGLLSLHSMLVIEKPKKPTKLERQLLKQAEIFSALFPQFRFQAKLGRPKKQ